MASPSPPVTESAIVVATEAAIARAPAPSKPSSSYDHPPYAEMILTAVSTLNEKKGSSGQAIKKFIEQRYRNLPSSHSALVRVHLRRLKQSGRLIPVRYSYKLSDGAGKKRSNPSSDPALPRGRGRPRKLSSGGLLPAKRARGRPRKVDGLVGASVGSVGTARRGRPSKRMKPGGPVLSALGERPRGRPRKPSTVAPGRKTSTPSTVRPRGRPRKAASVAPAGPKTFASVGRPRGRPKKATASSRPAGTPEKLISADTVGFSSTLEKSPAAMEVPSVLGREAPPPSWAVPTGFVGPELIWAPPSGCGRPRGRPRKFPAPSRR